MKKKEQWKDVPGFKGYYRVSSFGRVRSIPRVINKYHVAGKMLSPHSNKKNRYPRVCLVRSGKILQIHVHRLVLTTFVGACPDGMQCCHLDGDPANNRLTNLRWDTPKANASDRDYHGRTARGWRVSASKVGNLRREAIMDLYCLGYSPENIAKILGHRVKEQTIRYLIATY